EKYCGDVTESTQEVETPSTEDEGTAVETPSTENDGPAAVTPSPSGGSEASDDSIGSEDTSNDTEEASGDTSVDNLSFEQQVVALVNEQRAANGLAPLTLSQPLSDAARAKSQDMHDNNYFSHTSPTFGSPFEMLSAFGISYRTAGENIAMGYSTPEAVMNGWMNSAGHRANILNANYTQIGVGYVADGNYWTQEFIG
ncbi:MAG: secretion protein, partial [Clostridia bacterium]|nr:secretion protein [Clostridia bacterium]